MTKLDMAQYIATVLLNQPLILGPDHWQVQALMKKDKPTLVHLHGLAEAADAARGGR